MGKLIQMVHVLETWFESGVEKFKAGTHHPLTGETQHLVNIGTAKIIEIDPDLDKAIKARAKADAALAIAKTKADEARVAQEAAEELDRLAKDAEGAEAALKQSQDDAAKAAAEQKEKDDALAKATAEAQEKARMEAEEKIKAVGVGAGDGTGNTGDLLGDAGDA